MLLKLPFLAIELILYILILTTGGSVLVWSSFGAILLCFLYAAAGKGDRFIKGGLCLTMLADLCLVVCDPVQRLWGMVFFLAAQSLYACRLHAKRKSKTMLYLRLWMIIAIELAAILILRSSADALALVSVCYYALLVTSIVHSFLAHDRLFAVALCLFVLCDTVVGLQVAANGYLPISRGSALHSLLFMDFNLSWFFYLPSQVLIALRSKKP